MVNWKRFQPIWHAVRLVSVVSTGIVAAAAGFFVAAFFTGNSVVLAVSGAVVCAIVTAWEGRSTARRVFPHRAGLQTWLPIGITVGTLLLVGGLSALFVFRPMPVTYIPKEPTAQTRYWNLPTGSRIAYVHVAAQGPARPTPVVMLHGGPGAAGSFTLQPEDERLASAGFAVYRYDQVGSGLSSRLEDIRQYSVARHVADLEAIREALGAERLILVGGSWGGTLAAHYMAAHPERVERVVFGSPGAIWPPAFANATNSEAADGPSNSVINEAATLRFAVVLALQAINPVAASQFASDDEMSGFFQPLVGRIIATDVAGCDSQGAAIAPPTEPRIPRGFGYYANMMTTASLNRTADPRPALAQLTTPVLILRGACDRLRWEVQQEYQNLFANSTLLVVDGVGHNVAASPRYADLLVTFLLDQPLP